MTGFDEAIATLDERFRELRQHRQIPGVAWGVLRDGSLAHAAGDGTLRDGEDHLPDADSVFRIASMTKSFTAATILSLRDEGRLRLDDEAARYVPALEDWRGPTADAPPVTLRHLLTMSAGLPTDDPWGDRQQPLPIDAFEELLAQGPTRAWTPGTIFEYSNLGYAILGRVITAVAGREYREVVEERILRPLGLDATRYRIADLPRDRVAQGYVRRDDRFVPEGMMPYGTFASMGGLFSSVRDLSGWVSGFLDAVPARDEPETAHPLRRSTRREMQQAQRILGSSRLAHPSHEEPAAAWLGYGLGLFVTSDAELGTIAWHSGGYPGFGSIMAWHPASGIGIVALGNVRYAPVGVFANDQLRVLLRTVGKRPAAPHPLPEIEEYQGIVERLLTAWDDAVADTAFAMNMDLDLPRAARREEVGRLAADLGPFVRDEERPVTGHSPADRTWWLRGARGWVRAQILLSPEPHPRLQRMVLSGVPDPSERLRDTAERLMGAVKDPAGAWPSSVAAAPALDIGLFERSLRAAGARFGRLRLGLPIEGDATTSVTFELRPADEEPGSTVAPATLEIALDEATGAVTRAVLSVAALEAPREAW